MNLYDQSVATYRSRLSTLSAMLAKAEAHEAGEALLQAKLSDDMHPLAMQIKFVTNIPGDTAKRLGLADNDWSMEPPTSFSEAKALIAQTSEMLDGISREDLPSPDARVEFSIGDGAYNFEMSAEEYVREFSLPNFYFHLSMAYAILRMKGLEIGKADFIPHMMAYFKAPS
ncbi:MAG: DUF1993 domain-containing protein [Erythrobacter sp.]|uniref:DUF1993 domain-containing protein n=1 Tax=Erythrobacter sp. TaxID=1042 RepID=UPI003299E81D